MDGALLAGSSRSATLVLILALALPPARRLHGARLHVAEGLAGRARPLPARSASTRAPSRPGRPTCAACSRSRSSACSSSTPCSALQAVLPYSLGLPPVPEGLVVQHGGLVRDEHELAVVLARAHARLHRAARRPRRAELRLGRRRHRGRDRPGPRLRAPPVGHDRQLLGRPDPRHRSGCCCRSRSSRRSSLIAGGVVQNFNGFTEVTTLTGGTQIAARRPGRLAGGDQGARHERRRVLQRQLRAPVREPDAVDEPASRSCSCSRSRSRCRAPSARWSATTARATRSSPSWRRSSSSRSPRSRALELGGAGTAPQLAGGAMEGKEQRFGILGSTLFAGDHDAHLDRCGQLDARLLHRARRHDADAQHDARRGRPRRRRLGPLRHARARGHRGVRRRPAGRAARPSTSARRSARARSSSRASTSSSRRRSCSPAPP